VIAKRRSWNRSSTLVARALLPDRSGGSLSAIGALTRGVEFFFARLDLSLKLLGQNLEAII